jgi:hypothetical protein
MCTQRHTIFSRCKCTPVLIIKCPAQEFVEEQAAKHNKKAPFIYKYCVNFMITRDFWTGCCRGKAEGLCFAEREELRMRSEENDVVEESKDFDIMMPLGSTSSGRIVWNV